MTDANFRAAGLATGMDTNAIVDQLVALESRPIALLRKRQEGVRAQVSALGELVSRLRALEAAVKDLAKDGVVTGKVTSSNSAFTATPGAGAAASRHDVEVLTLARAAKWRSTAFESPLSPVAAGELVLTVQGKTWDPITVAEGATLSDLAYAIRTSGAPVNATIIQADGGAYLAVTARDTGFPDADPAQALSLSFTPSGAGTSQDPAFAEIEAARNATFRVDGLDFTRRTNTVTDAIPGVTLTLTRDAAPPEELVLAVDADGTKARLQKFVSAYNDVMSLVQKHLNVTTHTDRASTLAGDASVRALQARLQGVLVTAVPGLGQLSTLADVGIKTARDGSISIDATTFSAALGRDPSAISGLFSAEGGIGSVVAALVAAQTRAGDGILVSRQSSLNRAISDMDREAEAIQRRVDAFRQNLLRQFAAMESTVSSLTSIGNFLTQQAQAQAKASK